MVGDCVEINRHLKFADGLEDILLFFEDQRLDFFIYFLRKMFLVLMNERYMLPFLFAFVYLFNLQELIRAILTVDSREQIDLHLVEHSRQLVYYNLLIVFDSLL